ncbi:unnamed protein product, partial [Mesorhabditis spiculigera]
MVNQLTMQRSVDAGLAYIISIENQAMNNTNTAARLVMDKAQEAQQALLVARTITAFTVEQRYLINTAAYEANAEIESTRLQTIKMIEELAMQGKLLANIARNSLIQLRSIGIYNQIAAPTIRRNLQTYRNEMEKRAEELNKILKIYNSNVDAAVCRMSIGPNGEKGCDAFPTPGPLPLP